MEQYTTLADKESLLTAIKNLNDNGFTASEVATHAEALEKIKELIPAHASIMSGASKTLEQIGFIDYLKEGTHGWNNLKENILKETDPTKQAELRTHSVISDFYLGSAHAVSETGEIVIASASGSQLPHLVFTSKNIILVVSTQKITKTLSDAMDRLETHVYPLEDARMKSVGYPGSVLSKVLILKKEPAMMGRKFHVIFVNEHLGF